MTFTTGEEMSEEEHAEWLGSLRDGSRKIPERREPYMRPWYEALAKVLRSQQS